MLILEFIEILICMNKIVSNIKGLKMIIYLGTIMIVLMNITLLYSTPEIHFIEKIEIPIDCVPVDRNTPGEHHPHPSEEEILSIFESAGTYYGEAIGAEWILPDVLSGDEFI